MPALGAQEDRIPGVPFRNATFRVPNAAGPASVEIRKMAGKCDEAWRETRTNFFVGEEYDPCIVQWSLGTDCASQSHRLPTQPPSRRVGILEVEMLGAVRLFGYVWA